MEPIDMAYDFYEAPDSSEDLPPIILIHGIVWNKYMFRELAEKLCLATKRKESNQDIKEAARRTCHNIRNQVYCLDLRSHGESPFCEKCPMFEICEDVKYFLKVNELQKVSFVCHSFSTTISYMVALEKPEIVEKMVMVDSFPFNTFEKDLKDGYIPEVFFQNRILKSLNPKMSLKEARERLRKQAEKESKSQKLLYKKMIHDLKKEDGQFKWKTDIDFLQKRLNAKDHIVSPRGRCNHEILFVRCPNSINVTDEIFEKVLKYNPNSKLATIEDTSHLLLLEKVDEFVEVVSEFLSDKKYE
ncbi:protein ABHD11 [Trichonephila clavata]|uniref:sn-1-specific diacylglycerol lipase ABHD11 n=1 Tax=Trichonephila clavata TaxID=2740835 RepID=A0A8X6F4P1_TRICU|nr:protein ABHD11 [Trichonephila clavata]